MNEVKWKRFKSEIFKQYEMEKFRLNKIRQNENEDPYYKKNIEHGIEKTMTTLLRIMLIMEEFDESVKGIVNRELDELNKDIEGSNNFFSDVIDDYRENDEFVSHLDKDNHFGEVSNNDPRSLEEFFKRCGGNND